ncbi:MAG: N-acetylmuramoyl-L-alanine amidase [Hyphomicrobiaceae bacterium]
MSKLRTQGVAALTIVGLVAAATIATDAEARGRGAKRDKVTEIIVHATGGPFCKGGKVVFSPAGTVATMKRFFEASGQVSIHYIIGRDGEVAKSVPEDEVAIHTVGHNDRAIGIELINAGDGREPYTREQIEALIKVIRGVQGRWRIPLSEIKGHEDVDKSTFACGGQQARRKQDPGPLFPWERFRQELLLAEKAGAQPKRN